MTRILSAVLVTAAAVGCRSRPAVHGSDQSLVATYRARTLHAVLPATVRVQAVVAAADIALRDRGYAVTGSRSGEDAGTVEGRPADPRFMESVAVHARVVPEGTRVLVRFEPLGDESRSRAILDGILTRLGR